MKALAISGAVAVSIAVSPAALAQGADPITAIFGGITNIVLGEGAPPAAAPREVSKPHELKAGEIVPQRRGERFTLHGQRDERGYVQTTVKGRAVLVDPRSRRIVEVLD
jgi:hypothetical protein